MSETIEDLLADINSDVFLPGLQREFVWSPNQIETLFDSLIRGYPIGVLLKWDIRRARDDYYAYKFIPNYIADNGRVPRPITDQGFTRNNEGVDDAGADSLIIDGNNDGTDDTTTTASGADVFAVSNEEVPSVNARDGSITVNTTLK